jgi:hypothetical protein
VARRRARTLAPIWLTAEQVAPNPVNMDAPPRKKKPGTPERDFQKSVVQYLETQFGRRILVAAVVNEAPAKSKNGDAQARYYDSRRKAGVKKGFPDLLAFLQHPLCLLMEAKAKKGTTSGDQDKIHAHLRELGWEVHVIKTLDDVQTILRAHNLIR